MKKMLQKKNESNKELMNLCKQVGRGMLRTEVVFFNSDQLNWQCLVIYITLWKIKMVMVNI